MGQRKAAVRWSRATGAGERACPWAVLGPSAFSTSLRTSPRPSPYGGPPRSILGLCRGLARAGVEVQVFTTTANGADSLPASLEATDRYAGIAVRYFPRAFPRRLFGAARPRRALALEIGRYDLTHVHGLWHLPGSMAARQARRVLIPYVISPRGMLDDGALAHHARRKRIAYWLRERRHLEGAALLHATSDAELATLARRVPRVPVAMVPNGVEAPRAGESPAGAFVAGWARRRCAPLIVFLGRLHPIKRLDRARRRLRGGAGAPRGGAPRDRRAGRGRHTGAASSRCSRPRRGRALDRRSRRGGEVGAPGRCRCARDVLGLGELRPERARSHGGGGAGRHHAHVSVGGGRDRRLRVLGAPGRRRRRARPSVASSTTRRGRGRWARRARRWRVRGIRGTRSPVAWPAAYQEIVARRKGLVPVA